MERPAPVITGKFGVGSSGLGECDVLRDMEIALQRNIDIGNPREHHPGELNR